MTIRRAFLLSIGVFALVGTAAAQWTVINLHPSGASYSYAAGMDVGTQVGEIGTGTSSHASLWHGTPASCVDVNPIGAAGSYLTDSSGGQQVGTAFVDYFGGTAHAGLWSGTAASWVDLNPLGATSSEARGTDGVHQVGNAHLNGSYYHAILWSGSANSWVDLNPAGATSSEALDVHDGLQVGAAYIGAMWHAALWSSTAASWVDLNPPGAVYSSAWAIDGDRQLGDVSFEAGEYHACIWTGTAASWIDLHPAGGSVSRVLDGKGGKQVGYVDDRAALWSGTPGSYIDLHSFLPSGTGLSTAYGIWSDASFTYVVGAAYNAASECDEALMWVVPNNVALLQDFSITSGKRVSGGLRELGNSDDSYLGLNAIRSTGGRKLSTEVVVGATAGTNTPSTLTVKVESHVAPSAANGEIALRNWSTGQFVTIQNFVATTTDNLVTVPGIGAAPYVRADGRIEVRVRSIGAGQSSIDMVRVELTP